MGVKLFYFENMMDEYEKLYERLGRCIIIAENLGVNKIIIDFFRLKLSLHKKYPPSKYNNKKIIFNIIKSHSMFFT